MRVIRFNKFTLILGIFFIWVSDINGDGKGNIKLSDDLCFYINKISELELILNKDMPTLKDFDELNVGKGYECASCGEQELNRELEECKKKGWEPLSNECISFTNERAKNPDKSPSFYLLKIKEAIQGDSKGEIQFFISPKATLCYEYYKCAYNSKSKCGPRVIDMKGVVKIGKEYKDIVIRMGCKDSIDVFSIIADIYVDGKWLNSPEEIKNK